MNEIKAPESFEIRKPENFLNINPESKMNVSEAKDFWKSELNAIYSLTEYSEIPRYEADSSVEKYYDDVSEVIPQTELPESLTMEKKIEKQNLEIQAVESGEKSLDRGNTKETGNYGEMKTDQFLRSVGFERISMDTVTDIDESGHHGIDGIYYHADADQCLIVDAKYGSSQLNPETRDGKQMSANWINQRLDGDLGKEKADSIRLKMLLEPEKVISAVAHISADGTVKFDMLDEAANVVVRDMNITEKGVMVNG